jgi:hypothetical protein
MITAARADFSELKFFMEMPAPGAKRAFVIVGQDTLPVQPGGAQPRLPSLDHWLGEIEGEFPDY